LDDRGSVHRTSSDRTFSLLHRVHTGSGAHLTSVKWVPGAIIPEVKRPGRETDNSLPPSAEVKNTRGFASTPPIRFHDVVLS
jgi:hypothetical protein